MNEVLLPGGAAGAPGQLIKRLGEHHDPGCKAVVGRGTGSSGGRRGTGAAASIRVQPHRQPSCFN